MIYRRIIALLALAAVASGSVLATPVSSGQAYTLISLKHETAGALTRILVESSSPPLYTVLRPTDRMIIVDFPGGEGSKLATDYAVKSALVDSITVRKGRDDAPALTRLEIGVRGEVRDRSTLNGNTLIIELSPLGQVTNLPVQAENLISRASSTDSAKSPEVTSADAKKAGVYVNPQPVTTVNTVTRPATFVRAVRTDTTDGAVRVIVDADGAAQYKDFTLPDPPRIIVDVTGVRSSVGNKTLPVATQAIDRVRVGQPSSNVLRIVLDAKKTVPYRVTREGASLVIAVGEAQVKSNVRPAGVTSTPDNPVKLAATEPKSKGDEKANELIAANVDPLQRPQAGKQQPPSAPNKPSGAKETITQTSPANQPARPQNAPVRTATSRRAESAFCDPGHVGGPISFDLRAGVDIRDMLRFISQQYGVNFIVDKSVGPVPVDIRVTDIPWNQAIESVLRANRLGAVCESEGRIIRIATLAAVKEEQDQQRAVEEARLDGVPLITKVKHLRYARAIGSLAATGAGSSGRGGGASGGGGRSAGGGQQGGAQGTGSLLKIIESRLSKRGKIEVDGRTNSLIITDLPGNITAIEEMIALLDRPEPQVEIEARIIIANRNFLRDLGSEIGAAAINTNRGATGFLQTTPLILSPSGTITPGGQQGGGGSGGGGGGTGGGTGSGTQNQLGPNLVGPFANNALRATANTVLSLTTGAIGTSLLSWALSASESKGTIRTIASPRITAQDNQTAEIVNGIQIPIQTVSNNTITTTFVTAALRLEITPQIIEDTGEVLMHVVAENNSVNTAIAQALGSSQPGIDTQSAESVVRVSDGGTTVMGGITIDRESQFANRTPGLSRVPLVGNLFKRKSTSRNSDEILFFITPRIVRPDGTLAPSKTAPERGAAESTTNPSAPQVAPQKGAAATTSAGSAVGQAKK